MGSRVPAAHPHPEIPKVPPPLPGEVSCRDWKTFQSQIVWKELNEILYLLPRDSLLSHLRKRSALFHFICYNLVLVISEVFIAGLHVGQLRQTMSNRPYTSAQVSPSLSSSVRPRKSSPYHRRSSSFAKIA